MAHAEVRRQCGADPAGGKSTSSAYERVISVVMVLGTEKWLLTS